MLAFLIANQHPASFHGFHLTAMQKLDSFQTDASRGCLGLVPAVHLLYPHVPPMSRVQSTLRLALRKITEIHEV